jgi:hypothetical protein
MGVAMINERDGRAHYGAWRAACALPSLFGSILVLAMAFGWAGLAGGTRRAVSAGMSPTYDRVWSDAGDRLGGSWPAVVGA